MSQIKTTPFGGSGGASFPVNYVREIGLRSGRLVDQIRINGTAHGRDGGVDRGSITLNADEYISEVQIRAGQFIDFVKFKTNLDSSIEGGRDGGTEHSLKDIRVIGIGGRAGKYVDKLDIMYINKYKPSIIEKKNVGFILSFSPPFEKFEEYEGSIYKTLDSYEKVTASMKSQKYSANVEGEYYVKVSASTEIQFTQTSTETIVSKLETELTKGSKRTQRIPKDYVGIKLVKGNLMKAFKAEDDESDDLFWMYPTSTLSYSVIKVTDFANVLKHYDLTGELDSQMPGLASHNITKNGYVYYE